MIVFRDWVAIRSASSWVRDVAVRRLLVSRGWLEFIFELQHRVINGCATIGFCE